MEIGPDIPEVAPPILRLVCLTLSITNASASSWPTCRNAAERRRELHPMMSERCFVAYSHRLVGARSGTLTQGFPTAVIERGDRHNREPSTAAYRTSYTESGAVLTPWPGFANPVAGQRWGACGSATTRRSHPPVTAPSGVRPPRRPRGSKRTRDHRHEPRRPCCGNRNRKNRWPAVRMVRSCSEDTQTRRTGREGVCLRDRRDPREKACQAASCSRRFLAACPSPRRPSLHGLLRLRQSLPFYEIIDATR